MKIFVGCSGSKRIEKRYLDAARDLGMCLAHDGHTLIFGSSDAGMMGELCEAFKSQKKKIISVYPVEYTGYLKRIETDEVIDVASASMQLLSLVHMGDATIIMPGSFGTLSELITSIHFKKLGEHQKKIIIYNFEGFYDDLLNLFDRVYSENFEFCPRDNLFCVANTLDEVMRVLEES